MGVIEEGAATGCMPSEEVFAVHYPAYPSSLLRAVETLGGIDAVTKVHSSKLNKLELHFRPEDPCSHPCFGQLHPCNAFLLKLSKRHSGSNQNDNCSSRQSKDCSSGKSEKSSVLSADIVARVPEAYEFTGMVDYQHVLAVHGHITHNKERRCSEEKGPFEKGDLGDADDDNLMMLVPPLFSLKDIPENLVLRPSMTLSSRKKQEGVVQHRWEVFYFLCRSCSPFVKSLLVWHR
ncbi:General transcription factor 3C polypeptide 5 [Bienertia sinuspersici]